MLALKLYVGHSKKKQKQNKTKFSKKKITSSEDRTENLWVYVLSELTLIDFVLVHQLTFGLYDLDKIKRACLYSGLKSLTSNANLEYQTRIQQVTNWILTRGNFFAEVFFSYVSLQCQHCQLRVVAKNLDCVHRAVCVIDFKQTST